MTRREAFLLLELEEGADKKAVRRAYAQKVKTCHPEENPEGWKRLHDAYETALAWTRGADAQWAAQEESVPESVGKRGAEDGYFVFAEPPDSDAVNIEQISQYARELREERETNMQELELRCKAVEELQYLFNHFDVNRRKVRTVPWEEFFTKKKYASVFVRDSFLSMLGEMFDNRSVAGGWRDYFALVIQRIDEMRMDAGIVTEEPGEVDAVKKLRRQLDAAYGRYADEKEEEREQWKRLAAMVCVLVYAMTRCSG